MSSKSKKALSYTSSPPGSGSLFNNSGCYYNYAFSSGDKYKHHIMTEYPANGQAYSRKISVGNLNQPALSLEQRHLEKQQPEVESAKEDDEEDERGHWGSKAEFILSCIGFSVGIGNVWRFPYLAYQNGGGAFLLPYVILLILVGKPMYYMETAIGQYARCSPVQLWRCAPIAVGVGIGMVIMSLIVCIYYNVIMAYSVIYIGASFVGTYEELPWSYCDARWNSNENCTSTLNLTDSSILGKKRCYPQFGITENCTYSQTASSQFWERYVLNLTEGGLQSFGDLGGFKYDLPLALLFSWLIVFLCLMKGVKSSGKVVYFTATFPYVILIALLVRGCMLEGAVDGLRYLFIPDFDKLTSFSVWRKAAEQMFFSLGISWGGLMMFGSYNKFDNKVHVDASIVSSLDFLTSIISSVVIFSVLGHLSHELGVDIEHVAEGGQGLAFIAYPEALSRLPIPALWSILFFVMLFLLGLDSEFALLETCLTVLYDGIPLFRRHKILTTFVACSICFLLGLPCVSHSGQYVLDLMDTYGAGFAVIWIAFWEIVGLMWIYGYKNVCRDFKLMLGSEPCWFWKMCWVVIAPVFLAVIFLSSVINWTEHKYSEVVPYPDWATGIGWGLVIISAVQVPVWAVITTVYYICKGRPSQVIKPTDKWGPGDKEARKAMLEQMAGIPLDGKFTYENHAMGYEAYHM